jgi:hypothetical protein
MNTASESGLRAFEGGSAYIASKDHAIALTRQLTFDYYAQGVGVRQRVGSDRAPTAISAKPDAPLTQMLSAHAKSEPNRGRRPRWLSLLWRDHCEAGLCASPRALMPVAYPDSAGHLTRVIQPAAAAL